MAVCNANVERSLLRHHRLLPVLSLGENQKDTSTRRIDSLLIDIYLEYTAAATV